MYLSIYTTKGYISQVFLKSKEFFMPQFPRITSRLRNVSDPAKASSCAVKKVQRLATCPYYLEAVKHAGGALTYYCTTLAKLKKERARACAPLIRSNYSLAKALRLCLKMHKRTKIGPLTHGSPSL